uniref:C2 domain-containing protein n=1 Tax=Populus trichocarpa TaxID=3694 RepID=A0A3N7G0M8_POPTR
MRLYVYVLQGKGLAVKDTYFILQVGKHKSKTRVFRNNSNPVMNEEFVFRVNGNNDQQELVVSVFNHDDDDDDDFGSFFNGSGDLVGRVQIPVWSVAAEQNQTLPPTWFSLEKPMTDKFINMDCGKILLSLSLSRKCDKSSTNHFVYANSNVNEDYKESEGPCISSHGMHGCKAPRVKIAEGKKLMKTIVSRLERVFNKHEENSRTDDSSELTSASSDCEDCDHSSSCSFVEGLEIMSSRDNEQEMPENLQGGILLDKIYVVPSWDLNMFLFAPNSLFMKDLEELQGTTDAEEGPWKRKSANMSHLTRTVSYTKAATKLVKSVKATEEQTYIKADGKEFAVLTNVSTPEVPYGNTFNIELLYKILPGPEISSGEASSHLLISWGINFCKSTMMKGMIEGGARQGLKESFDQFANLLAQNFKTMDSMDSSNKDHMLAKLEAAHQSEWQLASDFFWNFTAVSTIFMILYVVVHIFFCEPSIVQGLEFNGLDLPDSFGQLITCAILVIQLERVCNMMKHFIQARLQRGSDHGVRAQGEGWVLTVALIEGTNLPSLDSTGLSDPYVVLTCNGKTRTSSIQLHTSDPQWNGHLTWAC